MARATALAHATGLLAFPFQDPDWKRKAVVGSALGLAGMLFPLLPWLPLLGYFARVMRRAAQGAPPALPEWDEWDRLILDGLRWLGALLLVWLPLAAIFLAAYALMFAALVATERPDLPEVLGVVLPLLGLVVMFVAFMVTILLGLASAAVLPAALAYVTVEERFAALFQVSNWWPVYRANVAGFLTAAVLALGLAYLWYLLTYALYVSIIFCCLAFIVSAPLGFYLGVVAAGAFGQAYADGVAALGAR